MMDAGIDQRISDVRARAEQLVAQLGGDQASANPLLQAVAALEHALQVEQAQQTEARGQAEAETALFQQVLNELPIGICLLRGPDQIYTFNNPLYEQVVGRSDMVGTTVREQFPEIANQGINELLDQVYRTGEPFVIREMMIQLERNRTGVLEDIYFDLTYRPLRASDGTIIGVVAYVIDGNDQRALEQHRVQVLQLTQVAQQTAEAERQRLLQTLYQAPSAMCILEGPEHSYTFTNLAHDRLTGRTDFLGKAVRAALPEVEGQGFFELLDQVYTSGHAINGIEVPLQLGHGDHDALVQRFITYSFAPLRDTNEQVTGIFVQAVDVTELVVARQRAEAAVAVRDQFLSVAAHELKTPLTSLLGYNQLLQRRIQRAEILDERTNRALTMMNSQAQRMTRLIDTLMNVARINMGELRLERVPLDLTVLTTRLVDEISVLLDQHAIEVSAPVVCTVLGDSLRLEQVFVNLLQNAIKYSPAGGKIAVCVTNTGSQACVCIQDWGIGIPQAALPRIFDRFYRVSEAAGQSISGMGIGLSVVNEIVTLHGGTITVTSVEGEGSTFTVCLPLFTAPE